MHIIDRSLPVAKRPGQGYILSTNNEPIEFQAAYCGFGVVDSRVHIQNAFKIFKVDSEGKWISIHSNAGRISVTDDKLTSRYEGEFLIEAMKSVEIERSRPIYLDPLEEKISLEYVFEQSEIQRAFHGTWKTRQNNDNACLLAPVGFLDFPQDCSQEVMSIDFEDQDGHLWIVGAPGSGKSMTLETILLSLALTNTPEQVQFYIVEYGNGRLSKYENLPHTGAVIRLTDPDERLTRLLNFLNDEMDRRMARQEDEEYGSAKFPAVFIVINNFAELRTNYPDQAERISRIVRDGNAVGLHVIIATNRKVELGRLVVARRIVLRLSNRDEYMDAVGKAVQLSSVQAEGRGVWVVDQKISECQISQPSIKLDEQNDFQDAKAVCLAMQKEWNGLTPKPIEVLPSYIPFSPLLEEVKSEKRGGV
ncbi:MAG TPA: FtsK/SpoIIIE domain-containing protein, partial [Pseudobdellovibrionaceae bacterium]|nr:FtsK/SpoIIIE domain-containing protein [Pseudobdellovibrionaceae bacterium]